MDNWSKRKAETDLNYGWKGEFLEEIRGLNTQFALWVQRQDDSNVPRLWTHAVAAYQRAAQEIEERYAANISRGEDPGSGPMMAVHTP